MSLTHADRLVCRGNPVAARRRPGGSPWQDPNGPTGVGDG
jgi:hypothetical protein